MMGDGAGLEIADVVGRIMHKLHVADAPLMRFLQSLQPPVEKIEPLYVGDDRWPLCFVRRLEISRAQRSADVMMGDQFVEPGKAVEVVTVKFARRRRAHHSKRPFCVASEHGPVRHVG